MLLITMKKTDELLDLENSLKYSTQRAKGLNPLYIAGVLINHNFKSLEREIIYILHILNLIDLKDPKTKSSTLTSDDLLYYLFDVIGDEIKLKKNLLYKLTGLTKDTFRGRFFEHLTSLGLEKYRSFTIQETYDILCFWQGDNNWGKMKAILKVELAAKFTNGSYEKLEELNDSFFDFKADLNNKGYKNFDKFSPKHYKDIKKKMSVEVKLDNERNEFYLDSLLIIYLIFIWKIFNTEHNPKLVLLFGFIFYSRIDNDNKKNKFNNKAAFFLIL